MLHFIGQPKFSGHYPHTLIGYELFARECRDGHWQLPEDFNAITPEEIEAMLIEAVKVMGPEIELLSFNLEQRQFIDPAYTAVIAKVQATTAINLLTELTERQDGDITHEQLRQAANRFVDAGLTVCIDDVGTGANTEALVDALDPAITEYKFALQNLRPYWRLSEVANQLAKWYNLAKKQHKVLAIEGIETPEELAALAEHYPAKVFQGYLLGRPEALPEHN